MDFTEKEYNALVEDIFRRFPSVQKSAFHDAYKPGLGQMDLFDEALGRPSRAFRAIHVAGTNGKGSVAHMLASVLSAGGMKTGLYTSPHLLDFRERARCFPGGLVPKDYVFEFLTRWKPYFEEHRLSFFEITTGLAFRYFADCGADVAVIETGLGGRLDSTNILPSPELTVITSIGLDHCDILGHTLGEIAAEKAGIFKDGVPALVGESNPETDSVFEEKAWMRCPLTFADRMELSLGYRSAEILRSMDLRGEYQMNNLRTVLAAVDILKKRPGFEPLQNDTAVLDGIVHAAGRTGLRGRWEKVSDLPYVICDIGHNPSALKYNFAQLQRMLSEGECSSLLIVYGVMADKDLGSILPLMPADATYIFTTPDTPRALPSEEILSRYNAFCASIGRSPRAYSSGSVREAVNMAITLARNYSEQLDRSASAAKPVPALIYIGGSTFVVAEALPLF